MATKLKSLASTVHEVAQKGFGKGTNELYDRARPSFPHTAIDKIWQALPARTAPLNILEMGCGTGLFTRSLLSHPQFAQHTGTLLATDPSEGMRSVFMQRTHDPRVRCEEGTFDSLPAEDGWADLVVAAQAWHWCPDHDKALTEIHRVLRPSGVLCLIWNMEDRTASPWVASLRDTYEPYEQGTPQFRLGLWRATFQSEAYKKYFEPEKEDEVEHIVPTTREGVVNRVFSKSYMTALKGEEREEVRRKLEAIADKGEGRKWIDEKQGVFEWPYKTYVLTCKLKQ
ncbi:S-adenosyl-L-methionine-dependent methyltransferase [Calocera viscosa TUFC12733]|uniref:S-adenosyl-L-methionine-dependent methyltransferase n=1 Tax=Calocera viscosa (strain TUFC12733) TaxID=1330018 RepID=A0A167LIY9_CALVF|nr:S-adenosyl-L-methionine-dependent methyltransferase [Calocera viscosa TUFC12733]